MTQSERESDAARVAESTDATRRLVSTCRLMENEACANVAAEHGELGRLIAAQIRSRMLD